MSEYVDEFAFNPREPEATDIPRENFVKKTTPTAPVKSETTPAIAPAAKNLEKTFYFSGEINLERPWTSMTVHILISIILGFIAYRVWLLAFYILRAFFALAYSS